MHHEGLWGFSAEEWQAFAAWATFVVAAVAAILALIQLNNYLRERWQNARPYLIVDLQMRPSGLMQVEIRNISSASAADVSV